MLSLKTKEEIALIRESGDLLGKTHAEVAKIVKPGVKTSELDELAYTFIGDHGAYPSFKQVEGYNHTLCISVNDAVVHGIPGDTELKDGDIVSIDCGVLLNDYHSDSAYTYAVGEVSDEVIKLLEITKESLFEGIKHFKLGGRIGDVGNAVQKYAESRGCSVIRELVGHGIGRSLHEKPEVPNYGRRGTGIKIKEGLVIALEPMLNLGRKEIYQENDGWTIRTKDGKPSAHFEHTIAVEDGKTEILTTFKYIEEVLNK